MVLAVHPETGQQIKLGFAEIRFLESMIQFMQHPICCTIMLRPITTNRRRSLCLR